MSFPDLDTSDELFVFTKQVGEFMKDDTKVFMILASMKDESKVMIGEFSIVCDFPEVFLDDINELLMEREIEFTIDLVHSTSLVSMDPYRIYASKLCELKKRMEDPFEKKFALLSVSPLDASMLLVKKKDSSMRLCVDY